METARPRTRRDTDTEDAPASTEACPGCANDDPHARSHHYLSIAKFEGHDGLRHHVRTQYVTLREPDKKRPDVVDGILAWVTDLSALYSNLAHPETGAPLTWHDARAYCAAQRETMAERAFRRAPDDYRWQKGPLEPWLQEAILRHARPVEQRQPGDEALEDI